MLRIAIVEIHLCRVRTASPYRNQAARSSGYDAAMKIAPALGVLLLLVPRLASAEPACEAPLPAPSPDGLAKLPAKVIDPALLRAIVGSDDKGRAPLRKSADGTATIADCRGHTSAADWGMRKRKPGVVVVGARQALPDGRLAVWVVSGQQEGAPATTENGFLALVRLDGERLVVDAVGAWQNGVDAKRTLDASLFAPRGFVEPTGHTGTGGGSDSAGRTVWVTNDKGELVSAGGFDVEGYEDDLGTEGPRWAMRWKSTIKPGTPVRLIEQITWTLQDGPAPEEAKQRIERTFTLVGDKLVEGPSKKRQPPHPADRPAGASPSAAGKAKTLISAVSTGELRLTYDPDKISEATLRAAVELSPHAAPSGLIPRQLEMCVAGDPRYRDCGSRDIEAPHFLSNGEVNLAEGRKELDRVLQLVVPVELQPALSWLRRSVAFSLALAERKAQFAKTQVVDVLKLPIEGLDPQATCGKQLGEVERAPDRRARWRVVSFAWHNCMIEASANRLGEFPAAPWHAFLKAYGIREKLIGPTGD